MIGKKQKLVLENGFLIIFLSMLVGIVLLQANPMVNYSSDDGGVFTYIGEMITRGKILYIDVWDHKPPGIFYLDALGLILGHETRWGIFFLENLFLFGSTLLGYNLIRKLWGQVPAMVATAIWMMGLKNAIGVGNFTEEYSLIFNFLALYLFWKSTQAPNSRWLDFSLGLTLALSFLLRPNNIGIQCSIVLSMLISSILKKEFKLFLKKMLLWGFAVLLVLGGVCVYFWSQNALKEMLMASVIYNSFYAGNHLDILENISSGFDVLGATAWFAVSGYGLALFIFIRNLVKDKTIDKIALLSVIGWPVEILMSSLSGRSYGHYFIAWCPIMALLIGQSMSFFLPRIFQPGFLKLFNEQLYRSLPVVILLTFLVFPDDIKTNLNSYRQVLFNRSEGVQVTQPIAQYIRSNTEPGDKVLAWGGKAGINYMARRESPVAPVFYPLFVYSPITDELVDRFFQDLQADKPEMIVAVSDIPRLNIVERNIYLGNEWISNDTARLNEFFDFLDNYYVLEADVDNFYVFRLTAD